MSGAFYFVKEKYMARDKYGLPGIYNASPITLQDGRGSALATDINGNVKTVSSGSGTTADQVQGNVASGATDSGNPVKTGGVNMTTQPTLTDGQRGDTQLDTRSNTKVTLFANNTTTNIGARADNADAAGVSSVANNLSVSTRLNVYNGTSWDRMRGDTNGTYMIPVPVAAITNSLSNSTSTAYEASRVVKASAGRLFKIIGYNSKATAQFIQIFNSTTVPADTAVPVTVITAAGSSNFEITMSAGYGRYFSTGMAISNSSTGPTKTIGSADCWFDVQYI